MSKYNWTIYDIEEKLQKLYRNLKSETNNSKRELIEFDIQNIKQEIEEYFDRDTYNQEKLLTEYSYRKDDYIHFDFLKEDFIEFNRITNDFIIVPNLPNISLSKRDILDLTHDFYKTLNHYFFGNFMKNFSKRLDHIIFYNNEPIKYNGSTITLLSLKESFIKVNRNYTIMDVITTIHEYMHATSAIINPYHFYDSKYIFSELDTIFIELVATDYLSKVFRNDFGTIIKGFQHMERCSDAMDLTDTFKIMNFENKLEDKFCNNKQLKTAALLVCDLSGEELEEMLYMPDTEPEAYVTSYLFAIELYDLYLLDKEKALQLLRKIIELKDLSLIDYYKQIKQLGLYPNKHMLEYHTDLQKNINRLIRIKEKSQK